ncbi:hypothetical protein C8R44DRAFT_882374 [Mycena epipterygia]|nr:hypothetical protein C8R44DRAFT_882374 [Mycena epipterygia]
MFTPSAIIALTLIAASAPGLSAPVPAARELPTTNGVAARSIANLLEGFLGQGFESVVADFLGESRRELPAPAPIPPPSAHANSAPSRALLGGGIEFILSKLFSRSFTDLSDSEVNQLLEYINGMDKGKRELDARFSLPSGLTSLKTLGKGVLSGAAIGGLEKLLGGAGDSDSTTTTTTTTTDTTDPAAPPSATDVPVVSRRAFTDISHSEVNQFLECINGMGTKAARDASLNEPD